MQEDFPIIQINPTEIFPQFKEIPQPPKTLYIRGSMERVKGTKFLTIVGSRNNTMYGKNICKSLIEGLRGYPITIISGLALGIDSIAHQAAIDAGLPTIAFPGSGLGWKVLYPAQHRELAKNILTEGGLLISEYSENTKSAVWTFPRRNRLEAGISDMTIIIEAEEKSGTLITARLATEYNKTVGSLPGPINSNSSKGSNWLLRMGAVPITSSDDILEELGLKKKMISDVTNHLLLNTEEEKIIEILSEPKTKEMIISELNLDVASANILFSTLEIKGAIKENFGYIERIV